MPHLLLSLKHLNKNIECNSQHSSRVNLISWEENIMKRDSVLLFQMKIVLKFTKSTKRLEAKEPLLVPYSPLKINFRQSYRELKTFYIHLNKNNEIPIYIVWLKMLSIIFISCVLLFSYHVYYYYYYYYIMCVIIFSKIIIRILKK